MVIGKIRRIFNRSLSIAMAASIMATSVPQFSVTAMAQEVGMDVQENTTEQDSAEVAKPDETKDGKIQDEDFEDVNSKDDDSSQDNSAGGSTTGENAGNEVEEGTKDLDETEGEDVDAPDEDSKTEDDGSDQEDESDVEADDEKDKKEDKPSVVKKARNKVYAAASSDAEEDVEGKIIYENDFNSATVGDKSDDTDKTGTVVELADGNKAMEYDVALEGNDSWEEAFLTSYALEQAYETPVKEKMTMSYDIYFPNSTVDGDENVEAVEEGSISDFGTMKVQTVLNNGNNWDWLVADEDFAITAQDLGLSDVDEYSKIHISVDITGNGAWELTDLTSLRAVSLKVVGAPSTYNGKLYIDNVVLKDVSSDSGNEEPDEPAVEEVFYENNFDDVNELTDVVNVTGSELPKDADDEVLAEIAQLAEGNKAIKITADLSGTSAWADIFKMEIDLENEFAKTISDKVVMSYDLYFPEDSIEEDFGTMTAMGALKSGTDWTWVTEKQGSDYTTAKWDANSDVEGYKVFHVEINMNDFKTWNNAEGKDEDYPFADITPIKAVIPCLAGNTSKYKGDIYLDNLKVKAVGVTDGDDNPDDPGEDEPIDEDLVYKNDFDSLESLEGVLSENVDGANPTLAELAADNKAVKYSVKLSGSGWADIFKAQFNLTEAYAKTITDKVVMSYDVYFPADKVETGFDSMKAQAALSCGSSWTWASAKSIPEFKTTDLVEDESVPGYKKVHVEIDMTDFETWDSEAGANKPYAFEGITPIQAVIPCLAGSGSTYEGDLYLDNLEVWAVNESGSDIPEPTEDLFLELAASAWAVSKGYQYTGESKIANKTVDDKTFLVATMDYSNDASQGWSEAKFEYTHPETVATLQGYNAFKADVYYKPTDKTAGSFGIKLFANSPEINSDAVLPAGEAVDIPGLEGYYKAEFVLNNRFPAGAFTNLTFGFVGKNTDFVGDVYLDNMRFTKVTAEDVYVDSTILPKKGPGIQVVDDGRSIQTASGEKVAIAEEVAMVDANANDAAKNLYAYLKAVGESDSVIFGHQNDTHHKAGSKGDEFTNSDTKDLTGSIAGVVGIDTLSLTGNEASTWDTPEADRIAKVAEITREAAKEGAIITLSAHMPNFEVIDQRVKNYGAAKGTEDDNEKVGYWEVNGEKQYNFSGYTPGTTSGNIVSRIMPGQDLNYLYTDYLDLIADYAKAVEGEGITILFRPLHENTGSWFWWGAAFCDEQAYINLYRYTVGYLKETKNVHNIIYVYGPGSEAANVSEYSARYPGDAYVDMIGYDLYHQNPSQENEAGYLQSIKKQNTILRDFATAHNKLYAITETGVADKDATGEDVALQRTGNKVMDWYMQLLDEISDDGVSYFLVWANFSENGSFYLPYTVEKKEDGYLHGHEMMDEFIKFYNDGRSVFATDMNSEFKKVSGVTNTTQGSDVSGYFIAPQSGDRILPDENNPKTRIAAKVSGVDPEDGDLSVQFVVSTEFDEVLLQANYNAEEAVWEAELKDSALIGMGEAMGTITLLVNGKNISEITARFNMVEAEQDDMVPEDFEGYNGDSQQLGLTWKTNKSTGSEINISLTNDSEKVFGGDYGLQMDITLATSVPESYVGVTKSFPADWSSGNALEFYTIPEKNAQKIVIQVTAGGVEYEVYLQEYTDYISSAENGFPVKVTIPFDMFKKKNGTSGNLAANKDKIQSIGLWCNAIAKEGVEFPLSTTLYYDEFKVVTTDKTSVDFAPTAYKGIWFKEIPAQTYTGKAIKPDVQVYDDAKLLTPKKDYTVSYKNNTKAGEADVIIKGKGNYSETITGHFRILEKEIDELTITAPEYIVYNGKEQNIAVTVKDGKKKLGTKNDYTQVITLDDGSGQAAEVQKAKEEGTYKIKITMKGNYTGETELTCKVVKDKDLLSKATVTIPKSLDYDDGKAVEFDNSQIVVKLKGKVIPRTEEDGTVNYAVSYENNEQVGTATVVITAGTDSKYVGSVRKTFTIKGKTFSTKTIEITGFVTKLPYTGRYIYQNPVLKDKTPGSGEPLERNEDYRITYVKNLNAGTATMTITGLGKYSGTIKKNFTIDKVALNGDMVQGKVITVKQNRAGATPDVELVYEGRTLIKDRDYKLTYTGNKNTTSETKQAWINIAGKGNFKGSLKKAVELKIEPKSWDSGEITVEVPDMKYNSRTDQYKPNPVVYDNGKKLTKSKDYTVAYASNTKADIGEITDEWQSHEAKVIVTLSGSDYVVEEADGAKEFSFRITGKMISEAKVKIKPEKKQFFSQYGTELEQGDLTVTYKGNPVKDDEYDIVSYSKNDKKGKAALVLAGKGQYGGTKCNAALYSRRKKHFIFDSINTITASSFR